MTLPIDRRRVLRALGAVCIVGAATGVAAQNGQGRQGEAGGTLLDGPTAESIERGLKFLAARQQRDGSFGPSAYRGNVAVCGLAGMAMISSGSTPDRGPFGREVSRLVDYVMANIQESGLIDAPGARSHGRMYDHGFAVLFLAECYGMSPRGDLRAKLAKGVQLIVDTQNDAGGWRYEPLRDQADVSVTVCQVMALRAARNAGLHVPAETIRRASEYVKRCQNADGGFSYLATGGESAFPRSAAALVALHSAGIYDGDEIRKARDYLAAFRPREGVVTRQNYYFYGHYYAAQAMWHAGGRAWREWYRAVRDDIVPRQHADGSWDDAYGREYGTSMAVLILQMPDNFLPIFQR